VQQIDEMEMKQLQHMLFMKQPPVRHEISIITSWLEENKESLSHSKVYTYWYWKYNIFVFEQPNKMLSMLMLKATMILFQNIHYIYCIHLIPMFTNSSVCKLPLAIPKDFSFASKNPIYWKNSSLKLDK